MATITVADTFNVQVDRSLTVTGRDDANHAFIPPRDDRYVFRRELLSDVLAWSEFMMESGLFLTGPTGPGKSTLVEQVANRLNIPLQQVTGHSRLEFPELVGHHVVIDGDMLFQDGPLTAAMRHGHWLLVDEIDLLDPGTAAGLNGALQGQPLTIPENGGEVIHPADGFRVIATGNTAGVGDETGMYQGTMMLNQAFLDRFMVVEVDYPDGETEKAILQGAVGDAVPDDIKDGLIKVANEVRQLHKGEANGPAVESTLSTRTLVRWASLAGIYGAATQDPLYRALDRAMGYRCLPETREAIHQIVQRVFGE